MTDAKPPVRIAVDCMGGDFGPSVTLAAVRAAQALRARATFLLTGERTRCEAFGIPAGCEWVQCSQVVEMDDALEVALRKKKDSSLRRALELVRDGRADVCVSAGNTGALMALAHYLLKPSAGIERPALASILPNLRGTGTVVLDLGANTECSAEHLRQFALMGAALAQALDIHPQPRVALLNIGSEIIKGSETIKQAAQYLRQAHEAGQIVFAGNAEGNDIYLGDVDVVVCDGFAGNVALKASEGVAKMLSAMIRSAFARNWLTRLSALFALPVLNDFKRRADPRRYNGAALLGLTGLVFKSHGGADTLAFEHAILRAHDAAANDLLGMLHQRISNQNTQGGQG